MIFTERSYGHVSLLNLELCMVKRFLFCFVLQAVQTGICKLDVQSLSNFMVILHTVSYLSLCRNKCLEIATHLFILLS